MGMNWWDIAEIVVPVAASVVGTPAAGIAVSAAMKGGKAAAEGKGIKGIAGQAILGAGTGAAGALGAGALGKAVGKAGEKAATKASEKAVEKLAGTAVSKGGLSTGFMGIPQIAYGAAGPEALSAATETIGKGAARAATAGKVGDFLQQGLGEEGKSTGMLKTVKSGAKVVGAADQFAQAMGPQPPRFSEQHQAMMGRYPGMDDKYQFGGQAPRFSSTQTLGFLGGGGGGYF